MTVRSFDPRPGPAQCFNCQGFGHSSLFCHAPPRCVRCGGPHRGCDKPRVPGFVPYCCNCKGAHPASYRGCVKYIEAERQQRSARPGAQRRVAGPAPNRREVFPPLSGTSVKAPAATPVAPAVSVPPAGAAPAAPVTAPLPAPAGAPGPSYAAVAAKPSSTSTSARKGTKKRSRRRTPGRRHQQASTAQHQRDSPAPVISQTPREQTIVPVSYTHLDVYKRQVEVSAINVKINLRFCTKFKLVLQDIV